MAENQVYLIKSGQNSFVEETEAVVGISGGKVGIGTTAPEADLHVTGSVKVGGDLAVDGTFTTINSSTVSVDDKNIELGSTANPTDVTADGGGITVKGTTDKTFNWLDATDAWTSSEHLHLAAGKGFAADKLSAINAGQGLILSDTNGSGILVKGGKVGIHQATPVYDLDVDGSGNFASLYVDGNAVLTGEGSVFGKWEDGTSEGEIFYTGGNVGVGTDNPGHDFHVVGDSVVDGNFVVNGTSGNLNVSNFNVSGDSIVLNYLGDTLTDSRGGLIVKDSSDASKSLEYVEGSDFWLSSESVQIADGKELQTDKVRAIDAGGLSLQDDGGNGIFIEDGGQVGVNTSSPNYSLDVNGSAKIGSDFYAGNAFKISAGGAVGDIAPASDGDIIKWDDSSNKWVAGANVGGGGGGGVGEVPLATIDSLPSGQSIYQIDFAETYNVEPRIATQLEIDGEGSIIPYVVSGVSTSGYHLIFAQDIPNNNYRIHTTFGGRDVHWETGAGASLYYNDGDVSIQRNFTIGGNLTVNGTTTTVNTETVEIEDHNLVIAANTGYNQLDSQYPAGGAYAGILWGTGDAGSASPVSLTYQTNKGFAFEGGDVGIGTTSPDAALHVFSGADNDNTILESSDTAVTLTLKDSTGAAKIESRNDFRFSSNAGADEIMRLTADGNVGIGTTSPDQILTTRPAQAGKYGIHIIKPETNDSLGGIFVETDNSTSLYLKDRDATAGASTIRIKAKGDTFFDGGNVGIGTRVPDARLHVEVKDDSTGIDSANNRPGAVLRLTHDAQWQAAYGSPTSNVDYLGGIEFETKDSSGGTGVRTAIKTTVDHYANANSLVFYTAPNSTAGILERLRIQGDNGNVGIGTTDPGYKLDVHGWINAQADALSTDSVINLAASNANNYSAISRIKSTSESDSNGASSLTFSTRDSSNTINERMRIDSSGNVGIGTTNPGKNLTIFDQIDASPTLNQSYGEIGFGSRADGVVPVAIKAVAGDNLNGTDGSLQFLTAIDTANDDSQYHINPKMTIRYDGNVGIGTTGPGTKLSIEGTEVGTNLVANNNGASIKLRNISDTDGNFASLDFYNSTNYMTARIGAEFIDAGDRDTALYFATRKNGGNLTRQMMIDEDGNVGINTDDDPSALLSVFSASAASSVMRVARSTSAANQSNYLFNITEESDSHSTLDMQAANGISAIRIRTSGYTYFNGGNVGIGITDPGTNKLYVNGNIYASGTITPSSDDRVKHNEQNIVGAIETLGKITPKKYIKTADMYEANHDFELDADGNPVDANGEPVEHSIEAGVIAQQVLEVPELAFMVSPEGVDEDGNVTSPHGLNYNSLFTYAIAAIQEQQQIIEDLKSQNASLESRISALES